MLKKRHKAMLEDSIRLYQFFILRDSVVVDRYDDRHISVEPSVTKRNSDLNKIIGKRQIEKAEINKLTQYFHL